MKDSLGYPIVPDLSVKEAMKTLCARKTSGQINNESKNIMRGNYKEGLSGVLHP
jgi:CRISPR/Cas system CMR subunit Cmr4 (Cas7 group RAMP superfamily)